LETGVLVSEEVKISGKIQFVNQFKNILSDEKFRK